MSSSKNMVPNDNLILLAKEEEFRFLAILLNDKNSLMDAVGSGIKPSYFFIKDNVYLYSVIYQFYLKYESMLARGAMHSIVEKQESYSEEQKAARRMYYDKAVTSIHDLEEYKMLKHSISARNSQQKLYELVHDITPRIVGATSDQLELVSDFQEAVSEIENTVDDPYSRTVSIKDGLEEAAKHVIERREHPERDRGAMIGIRGIDEVLLGLEPASYTVVTGHIGGGKTTLMLNIGFNMAKAGYRVIYVSLEKEALPLYERLWSMHALMDYNRIQRGGKGDFGLSDYWHAKLLEAKKDLDENICPVFDTIQMNITTKLSKILSEVRKSMARMKREHPSADGEQEKPIILLVDYLQAIGFETHHTGRPDLDLAMVHKKLQAFGKAGRLVTITALQLKTASAEKLRGKSKKSEGDDADQSSLEVNTEDMSGTQQVGADADYVLAAVLGSEKPATRMTISFTKTRNNEGHRPITLDFDGRVGRITDPELESEQVSDLDSIVYNTEIDEKYLDAEGNLFDEDPQGKEVKDEGSVTDPLDFGDTSSSSSEVAVEEKNETPSPVEDLDITDGLIGSNDDEIDYGVLG